MPWGVDQVEGASGVAECRGGRPDHRGRAESAGHPPAPEWKCFPRGVVEVDHLDPVQAQEPIEPELGRQIGLHGSVVVQVIAGQVGEDTGRERQPVEPALVEAVTGGLHRNVGDASSHQLGQGRLQIDRAGGRQRTGGRCNRLSTAIEGTQRPDAAGASPRIEQVADQRRGGGLPIGAGDPDQGEPPAGMIEPELSQCECRQATVADHDGRNRGAFVLLDHHRRGAIPDRIGDVPVSIRLRAAHRDVDHSRRHLAAVGGDPADRGRPGRCLFQQPRPAQCVGQVAQWAGRHSAHTVTSEPTWAESPAAGAVRRTVPSP